MAKKGYFADIERKTLANSDFRHVLYTGKYSQLVLMSIMPGEEIGLETHKTHDQFFRFEEGKGMVRIDKSEYNVGGGDCIIVPAGAMHNIINTGKAKLKLYTIYSPQSTGTELCERQRSLPKRRKSTSTERQPNRGAFPPWRNGQSRLSLNRATPFA